MLTTLMNMDSKTAEVVLSKLMRALLPDASSRTQAQQFESLSSIERALMREIGERLGYGENLPPENEAPAALALLSRELSDVVLSKANVEELESRAFHKAPSDQATTGRRKPRVFIASSSEGIESAYALQRSLELSADAVVWAELMVGSQTSARLVRELGSFDFAVFLLTMDDLSAFRGGGSASGSQVLFVAGMFVGRLGVNRTFFVTPSQVVLGDIAGLLVFDYDPLAPSKDMGVSSVSHHIADQIRRFGPVGSKDLVNA
jgi:predicted nucleotide-binding protein